MRRSRPCPRCGHSGQFLADESRAALIDYYHCDRCGEFWLVDPMNPTKPTRTTPPQKLGANDDW
jgi:ribosomal protein S27AE